MTSGTDAGRVDLPLSGWLLSIAILYATLQQGAFHRGPFRVVAVLVVAAAAAHAAAWRRRPIDAGPVPVLIGLAFGSVGLSVLATGGDLRSAAPTVALTAMVLVTIAVVAVLRAEAVVRVVDAVIVCGLVAAATAWVGVAFHHEPWGLVAQGIWRGSSTITYANATGALAGIALLLALARLGQSAHRLAALPAYALAVGVLSTGSRAALLAVGVGILVLLVRRRATGTARSAGPVAVAGLVGAAGLLPSLRDDAPAHPGVALLGLLLGAVVVSVLSSGGPPPRWRSSLVVVAVIGVGVVVVGAGNGLDELASARFDVGSADRADEWSAALDELARSPVVGVGPGRLHLSWAGDDGRAYVAAFAHNEYLELLATQGVVGGLALVGCAVAVARHRRSRGRGGVVDDSAVAALTVLAVHSGFDFLWHVPVLALVGGVLAGLVASPSRSSSEPVPEPSRAVRRTLEPVP